MKCKIYHCWYNPVMSRWQTDPIGEVELEAVDLSDLRHIYLLSETSTIRIPIEHVLAIESSSVTGDTTLIVDFHLSLEDDEPEDNLE